MSVSVPTSDAGSGADSAGVSTLYTPTRPATQLAIESLLLDDLSVVTLLDGRRKRWAISGGTVPMDPAPGLMLNSISGLHAPYTYVDQQGAHQLGVTTLDATWEAAEIDLTLTFHARTRGERRGLVRDWIAGWAPLRTCRLMWFTSSAGHRWLDLRPLKEPREELLTGSGRKWDIKWGTRSDFPFWQSWPTTSPTLFCDSSGSNLIDPTGVVAPNFASLFNRGTEDGWPEYLAQGPGTFTFSDNGSTDRAISITLAAGEGVLIPTLPYANRVSAVAGDDASPFSRLQGRFATAVPASEYTEGVGWSMTHVSITVTGGEPGVSSVASSIVPWFRWPE